MTMQAVQLDATRPVSASPDWDLVPFEVSCARCGQDLYGLTDPVCPACEFRFDWSDAVPIEHLTCGQCGYALMGLTNCRCPECGSDFTWEGAIAAYHQGRHELFEYRWRDRPVRSLIRTVYLMSRPKRLWQQLDIHDKPRIRPLLFMIAAAIVAVPFGTALVDSFFFWARFLSDSATLFGLSGGPGQYTFFDQLERTLTRPFVYLHGLQILLWAVLTGAALLILRQSMKRYRILPRQVFRVWAYCVPIPAVVVWLLNKTVVEVLLMTEFRPGDAACMAFALMLALYLTYLLREGYRRYLKMPHAWGVAIAAHTIGFIGSFILVSPLKMWLLL